MRRRSPGQASIELIAMVPFVVLVGLLSWQLMAVIGAGLRAQESVRAAAIRAEGPGTSVVVSETVPVPVILPGLPRGEISARVGVRTP